MPFVCLGKVDSEFCSFLKSGVLAQLRKVEYPLARTEVCVYSKVSRNEVAKGDNGFGYVRIGDRESLHAQSSARPDFSDYRYRFHVENVFT